MKKILILAFVLPISAFADIYVDLSGGVFHKQPKGDSGSYKGRQSLASEVSLGHKWDKWDFSIDGLYSIGRQKDFEFTYGAGTIKDDYNWHNISIGPTLKYHIEAKSGDWSWAPFLGVFYNHTNFDNSSKLRDSNTGEMEDNSHEAWGYGGKLGVQFKTHAKDSSWLESVSYKIFGSYTKYRESEGDYNNGNSLAEYKGDTPDNLIDYSVGVMVGLSLGDKLYTKTKSALGFK